MQEYNATAGSRTWITTAGPSASRFTVSSTRCPGDALECDFDAESGTVVCTPGPAIRALPVRFRWTAEEGVLESDGRSVRIEEALRLVLDELVCVDEETW